MAFWQDNSACILDYLKLFEAIAGKDGGAGGAESLWRDILAKEQDGEHARTPQLLRERLNLDPREFLLVMAALALEMDGGLRGAFRSRYGVVLPTVEYGLELVSSLYPARVEDLAEFSGQSVLTGLLLTTAEQTAYPLERPLILCRSAVAFLTGPALPELPGIDVLLPEEGQNWLPLHTGALAQLRSWYLAGGRTALYLHGEAGGGRRTLLRRACGGAVCLELEELKGMTALDRNHIFREAVLLSRLLGLPVCANASSGGEALGELERFRRRFPFPLAVLTGDGGAIIPGGELLRLSGRLTAEERAAAWTRFTPERAPDSTPGGAMTVGALRETALLACRFAAEDGRMQVRREDVQAALRQRGGELEFGVHYAVSACLEDMVLPECVREQLRDICTAARCGPELAAWGVPTLREGVTAVFHGPSGTGKTMAAGAIAGELKMPLLRADLSQIMDKYVGETEKHLGRLMRCARENRCVLLFDEADALFGKRASVSTGHDKFANLSTSFLLQEIEQYDGVALLSTNLLSSFDDAFLRRLHYIVRFQLPDGPLREELWRRALPPDRLEGEIPFDALAQTELSPARINGVARAAAVSAMAEGKTRISLPVLVKALCLELEKSGKALPRQLAGLTAQAPPPRDGALEAGPRQRIS